MIDSQASGNGLTGVFARDGSIVSRTVIRGNAGNAVLLFGRALIVENAMIDNAGNGLTCNAPFGSYSGNVIEGNASAVGGGCIQFGSNVCDGNTTCP